MESLRGNTSPPDWHISIEKMGIAEVSLYRLPRDIDLIPPLVSKIMRGNTDTLEVLLYHIVYYYGACIASGDSITVL